ncbi:MAG: HEAT repeat domain-containing protein [Candidatus Heimdallarchaeota archaeon]|nr:HEAT repeat domain-containing protein [Candidatus Heimdallarchaeota archaeon]
MSKATCRLVKFGILAFTVLMIAQITTSMNVEGIVDFDRPRTIDSGYVNAFTHSVRNYKNQRFTITVSFSETVPQTYELHVFCTTREEWDLMLDGIVTVENMTDYKYYKVTEWEEVYSASVVIPDWEEWTFVFLNLNPASMLTQVRLEHQHVLWWLWIVIPAVVIIGLVVYGVMENVTKYERARMDSAKALEKIGSKKESERKRAAYWLISNGTRDDLVLLNEKLFDEKPIVRENAAFVIGGISKRLDDKSLAPALQKQYEQEEDLFVKEEIVGALSAIGDLSSLKILEKYLLTDHNENLRFKIAKSLGTMGSLKAAPVLIKVINLKNTDTLKIACRNSLANIASKENTTVDALIKEYSE